MQNIRQCTTFSLKLLKWKKNQWIRKIYIYERNVKGQEMLFTVAIYTIDLRVVFFINFK